MKKIKCVTISGADDNVNLDDMKFLSMNYPFVEWGILMSPNNWGKPRYPSLNWLDEVKQHRDIKRSLHLCGDYVRWFSTGSANEVPNLLTPELTGYINRFDRVQLNMAREIWKVDPTFLANNIMGCTTTEFLMQIRTGTGEIIHEINKHLTGDHVARPFLDVSGGTNVEGHWKLDVNWNGLHGFAGGINPTNVDSKIREIYKFLKPDNTVWIDMESGVRTDDKLDLDKVRDVLDICQKYIVV